MKKALAIVSDENEFRSIRKFLGEEFEGKIVYIHNLFFLDTGELEKNEKVFNAGWFLSEKTLVEIEKQAAFFAQNWYKFNKEFKKETTFDGISLGFVYTSEIFHYFRDMFILLEGIRKAVEKEKPVFVVANRNSVSGRAIQAAKKGTFPRIRLLDLENRKNAWDFPNLTRKKVKEARKKIKTIMQKVRSKEKKGRKKVFIRSRGYLGNLEKELSSNPELDVISLDEFLLGELLNPLRAATYLFRKNRLKARIAGSFSSVTSKGGFRSKFVFKGMNFFEMFRQVVPKMQTRAWPEFVLLIEFLNKFFEKSKPKAVVLWTDMVPFERICVRIAKKTGAASLVIQHGPFRAAIKNGSWITSFAPVEADKISVWGNIFRRTLLEHGVPAEKIVVTGTPKVDGVLKHNFDDRKIREELGVKKDRVVVLAPHLSFEKKKALDVAKAVEGIKGTRLVIKIHPTDSAEVYRRIVGDKAVVVQDMPLYDLIHASDVVIIQCSTVGMEAMYMGKPVVLFGGRQPLNSFYHDIDTGFYPKNRKELGNCLDTLLNNPKKREDILKRTDALARTIMFSKDGKSTERVAKLVYSMI